MIYIYFVSLIVSFAILFKSAAFLVDGACAIADLLKIPKMIIGIVLVGLATTAPEFSVSVIAALLGNPEIALGNAVGSVICDNGIALALAAILAPTVIFINCRMLKIAGLFLLSIDIFAFILARNGTIGRIEGIIFILILGLYFTFILKNPKFRVDKVHLNEENSEDKKENFLSANKLQLKRPVKLFILGLVCLGVTSLIINWASVHIAEYFSVSKTIIGLTVVAVGTSLPEISTCITAGLKGEGEIAVGNVIGADVLNILWIIGMSSIVNPISVELKTINFSFPYMIFMVTTTLICMRIGCRLGKTKGVLLFGLYLIYLLLAFLLFT